MNEDNSHSETPSPQETEQDAEFDFEQRLSQLCEEAVNEGIDLQGAYLYQNERTRNVYEVLITEVDSSSKN
ncbi:hypothetical protein [Halegenticoccus soli]|uniref:hypothetical protein n=1 Tax=Halegenticoccus soli TaxID=1985678 RepID=UPI00117B5A52|nr:hypothetical protein [Halegenticoccus soli]